MRLLTLPDLSILAVLAGGPAGPAPRRVRLLVPGGGLLVMMDNALARVTAG
jgi:hypothetical protein